MTIAAGSLSSTMLRAHIQAPSIPRLSWRNSSSSSQQVFVDVSKVSVQPPRFVSRSSGTPLLVATSPPLHSRPGQSITITRRSVKARASEGEETSGGGEMAGGIQKQQIRVGFLGLGIMGTAMARNLLKAGYEVTAWNRNPEKSRALEAEGARSVSSPVEVTSNSDITIAMLADPTAAVEVACGEGKAVLGLGPGKGYIDASTVDAESVKTIAAAVRAQGGQYLEAPVSGSKKPAEDGTLIFLTAGDKELFDKASGILDVLGKYKVYLGAEGNGASMKLVVNMVMGSMMTAFSEGLALGERAGLNQNDILDVIAQGAISSPMFTMKGPSMVAGNFPPAFPLKHQQKDLRLALALGDQLDQPLPVAAAANEVFKAAKTRGLGDNDFSAVIEAVKKGSSQ